MQVDKVVFLVYFSGEQARKKIRKICEAFGANCYPVPEDITKQRQMTREVSALMTPRICLSLAFYRNFEIK